MNSPRDNSMRRDAGLSMVELSIVMVVLLVLSLLITESIKGLATTQLYTRSQAQVIDLAERVAQDISRDVRYAVKVFEDSVEDRAFFDYIEMPSSHRKIGSRLPIASSYGHFEPDPTGKPLTGNILFMVTSAPHAVVDLSEALDGSDLLRIDTFQYLMYHLSPRNGDFDLGRWASKRVAAYGDLMAISNTSRRQRAGLRLTEQGIGTAWDQNAAAATAYHTISSDTGALTAVTSPTRKPVETDVDQTVLHMLARSYTSIAKNGSVSRIDVPKFANAEGDFPHGFEVKLDGSGGGRLLMTRLVLTRQEGQTAPTSAEIVRMASIRDI